MNPQRFQDKIYDWVARRYPDAGSWTTDDFHCYQDLPIELRAVLMTNKVEAEVANGGLPQLLWNCFFHWRTVLRDAAEGYALFGAAEQRLAIGEFSSLLNRYEPQCRKIVEECIRTKDFPLFGQWCESVRDELASEREPLFYSSSSVDDLRLVWLQKHEKHLLRLMDQLERRRASS